MEEGCEAWGNAFASLEGEVDECEGGGEGVTTDEIAREWTSAPVTTIWAKITQEGWHYWPGAPLSRVYLRHSHRHLFHFTVAVILLPKEVGERVVEFHDLQESLREAVEGLVDELLCHAEPPSWSCEHMATMVIEYMQPTLPENVTALEVTVSEDGECGATVRGFPSPLNLENSC